MMNVVFCGDSKVCRGIEVALYTLLTHNKNVNIYILSMNLDVINQDEIETNYKAIEEWQIYRLQAIVNYLDPHSNITFIDARDYYLNFLHDSVNSGTNFTPYASLRLILDKALPYVNDILYLDCDVAIRKNIESMYMECKNNKKYTAYAVYAPEAESGYGEMISGIMFIHLDEVRKNNFFERARHNYKVKLYKFPDQMALRDAGDIGQLDETYGYFQDYRKSFVDPYILHFTCFLLPKIYDPNQNEAFFFNSHPQFKYVKDGIDLIETINGF